MKVLFICLVLLVTTSSAYSQYDSTRTPVMTKQDYLKKSKNQKTAAWLLLAGGGTLIALGAKDVDDELGGSDRSRSNALVITGLAVTSVSVTLFIASARNKKKGEAMAFNFKMEEAPVVQQGSLVYNSYPALALRIKL